MFLFIILSLALCFLVQTNSSILNLLISPVLVYSGIVIAVSCIAWVTFKKGKAKICYDVFASSVLIVWFAYWKPQFNDDSPIFFFFPLYFALMAAFSELFFIGQSHKMDIASLQQMRSLAKHNGAQPWIVMSAVLTSLALQEHYLLYPVTMTLLLMRIILSSCLDHK